MICTPAQLLLRKVGAHQQHERNEHKGQQEAYGRLWRIVGIDEQYDAGGDHGTPSVAVAKDRPDAEIGEPPEQEADFKDEDVVVGTRCAADGCIDPVEQAQQHKVDTCLQLTDVRTVQER